MKETCHLSASDHAYVECGINCKVMQRLNKEAKVKRERRIPLPGVTG